MTLRTNQRVRLTFKGQSVTAIVLLVSENQRSVAFGFELSRT